MSACLYCAGTGQTSNDIYARACTHCKGTGTAPLKKAACPYCDHGRPVCGAIVVSNRLLTYNCLRPAGHEGECVACSITQHNVTGVKP